MDLLADEPNQSIELQTMKILMLSTLIYSSSQSLFHFEIDLKQLDQLLKMIESINKILDYENKIKTFHIKEEYI